MDWERLKKRLRADVEAPDFEALWVNLEAREETEGLVREALDNPNPGYEDLKSRAEEYAAVQRQYAQHAGYSGRPPGPERGKPIEVSEAEPTGYEDECMRAVAAYRAQVAGHRPDVLRLRERLLPDGLLTADQTGVFVRERAGERGEILEYVDGEGYVDAVPVIQGSELDRVRQVSTGLSDKFRWSRADATHFLLTGEYPVDSLIRAWRRPGAVTLEIELYASPATVRNAYQKVRSDRRYTKQHTLKGVRVLRFVLEETLKDGRVPSWAELTRRWNRSYPSQAFKSDREGLRAMYDRSHQQIIKPLLTLADYARLRNANVVPGKHPRR